MKVICGWCKKILKDGSEDKGISHGMCKPCFKKEEKKVKEVLEEVL